MYICSLAFEKLETSVSYTWLHSYCFQNVMLSLMWIFSGSTAGRFPTLAAHEAAPMVFVDSSPIHLHWVFLTNSCPHIVHNLEKGHKIIWMSFYINKNVFVTQISANHTDHYSFLFPVFLFEDILYVKTRCESCQNCVQSTLFQTSVVWPCYTVHLYQYSIAGSFQHICLGLYMTSTVQNINQLYY